MMRFFYRFFVFIVCLAMIVPVRTASAAERTGVIDSALHQDVAHAILQRLQPEQKSAQVVKLLRASAYRQAEAILSDLLHARPTDIDGYRLLERVYLQLSFTDDESLLDAWCGDSPSSHFPFTVRGMHYYAKARALAGTNAALQLTRKQRRSHDIYIRKARADLEHSFNRNPHDPGAAATLTALAIHLKQPRSVLETWFARTVDADPAWLANHEAKLRFLAPAHFGSDQLMAAFVADCFADRTPDAHRYIVALDWIGFKAGQFDTELSTIRFLTDPIIYEMLAEGLDRYIEEFPLSPRIERYRALRDTIFNQPYIAVAAFSDALAQYPLHPVMLRGRIRAYLANNQFAEAARDLQSLEQLQGQTPFSLAGRASLSYRSHHDPDAGSALYDRAIADESSAYRRKHYLLDRADINRTYARHTPAINDYSRALAEDILFEEAYLGRAKSYYAQGNFDAALSDLVVLKSGIRGRLAAQARSLIDTYLKAQYRKIQDSARP